MLKFLFLFLMAGGVPVAIAMAGSSLIYILISGDLPPFAVVLLGFAAMTLRSLWVAKVHWQRRYTVLERPESTMEDR